ncbi:ArfGap-domain-containing protein [Venturia nashicola]|uniref:ArfGap-domain-containing protein n=1 Tax=Venturia nashicola TaxID=86259 RepID=A0A4Z1PIK3_9PEZI|nr:ArfGap-domain-containing protein [Venturia nashicola]TLD39505.1 ArfGap-domain-containing protein [Venturia nashicola]
MASINKRQQVRNERGLQELIKTVPGNDRCADCATRNPGWASWSLGIFLCIRCAALHRKLGTHISKVKSLSMDSWSNDQVEVRDHALRQHTYIDQAQNMKRIGNVNSNHTYNSRNTKPSIPIDADEIEGVMERFIRQKYEHRAFAVDSAPGSRQNTGSTSSDERPPPLPPKPSRRFHFPSLRAASSTFPIRTNTLSPPTSPGLSGFGREPSPPPKDKKPAKFLGAEVGASRDDGFETKLTNLREMGFTDERKNMQVLRSLDGNVEKSVETLVRLGEGSKSSSRTHSPLSPSPLADISFTDGFTNGLTVDKTRTMPRSDNITNPFDINVHKSLPPPPAQGQTGARGAFMGRTVSPSISSNPFLQSGQQTQQTALDRSFQNMQISEQQQRLQITHDQSFQTPQNSQQMQQTANPQLFPNTTGGYNSSQPQTNPFLQTYTPPPMPQIPTQYQQFTQPSPFQPSQQQTNYNQQQATGLANPFLRTSKSQSFNPTHGFDQFAPFGVSNSQHAQNVVHQQHQQPAQTAVAQPQNSYNPFQVNQSQRLQQQQQQYQPVQTSSSFQQQQNSSPFQSITGSQPQQQAIYQEPQILQHSNTMPFLPFSSPASVPPQQQQLSQPPSFNPPQQQHQAIYPPPRQDNNSILALYNFPQANNPPEGMNKSHDSGQVQVRTTAYGQKRSVTMPVSSMASGGNSNPFAPNGTTHGSLGGVGNINGMNGMSTGLSSAPTNGYRHVSNESVQFGADMMMNGRHSPDAFAGLSARLR